MRFFWNEANIEHINTHAVTPSEAEEVIRTSGRGYPRDIGHGKFLVHGQTSRGRWLQVTFVRKPADS